MTFDENTKFGDLLDNPEANALLVKYMPHMETPANKMMLGMARGMPLKAVAGFPQAQLPSDKLAQLLEDLAGL